MSEQKESGQSIGLGERFLRVVDHALVGLQVVTGSKQRDDQRKADEDRNLNLEWKS